MLPQVEDAESAAIELRLFDKDKFDKDDAYGSVGTLRLAEVPRSYEPWCLLEPWLRSLDSSLGRRCL